MSVAMMQNAISRRRLSQRRALLGGTRGTAGDRTGTPTRPTTSHAGRLRGTPEGTCRNPTPLRTRRAFQRGGGGVPGGGDALSASLLQREVQLTKYTPPPPPFRETRL